MKELMDLVSAITGFQQAALTSKVQFAVAKKMLDSQRSQGNAAIALIDAATKGLSGASDELASAATGLGSEIDMYG